MGLLQFFKRKPLYETNFKKWITNCTEKQLSDYCDKIYVPGEDNEFDYTSMCWGHAFYVEEEKVSRLVKYGYGFYSPVMRLKGRPKELGVGSILLMKVAEGGIGKFLVLHFERVDNPNDMYWAYIVGIDEEVTSNASWPHADTTTNNKLNQGGK